MFSNTTNIAHKKFNVQSKYVKIKKVFNNIPSQYQVCKNAGLTESTLRAVINEKHHSVNTLTLFRICEGLGVSMQEFFDDELFNNENLDLE